MTFDATRPSAFEALGLLSGADRKAVERRAEALTALIKLGLAPPEGDAVPLEASASRSPEAVAEAARALRDPSRWLLEVVLWPGLGASGAALELAAELLEGAAERPTEPAALVRHLALEYLSEAVSDTPRSDQPEDRIAPLLAPPLEPPLYVGARPRSSDGGDHGAKDR